MNDSERGGYWLFVGLLFGLFLTIILYGLPPMFGDPPPENCDSKCLALLELPTQKSMASAAWAMFFLTAISVGMGVVSVVLIWLNLAATRQLAVDSRVSASAAVEASGIAKAGFVVEHRAWLKVERTDLVSDLVWNETEGRLSVQVTIRNVGRTQATNVWIRCELFSSMTATGGLYDLKGTEPPDPNYPHGTALFPDDTLVQEHSIPIALETLRAPFSGLNVDGIPVVSIAIVVSVGYRLSINDEPRYTMRRYDLMSTSRGALPSPTQGNVHHANMILAKPFATDVVAT